jgi:hypothetical protein
VSRASSELTVLDDQPLPGEQELVDDAMLRSFVGVAPEQSVDTKGERSVTHRERTITRAYAKQRGSKRGRGKGKEISRGGLGR